MSSVVYDAYLHINIIEIHNNILLYDVHIQIFVLV